MPSIPDRVLSLIEASGVSRHAFAQQVGLDDSKLSKSLNGTRRFSSLDLARIAELCKVSVDWLLTGVELPLAVAARTTTGDAGTALQAAKQYIVLRTDLDAFGYPQPWQQSAVGVGPGSYTDQGKRLAEEALARVSHAGLSISDGDLTDLVETVFGVDVAIDHLGTGFDGLAASSDEAKLILLATTHVPARQRFTLAHELGHLLAGDDQDVHLDRDIFDKAQAKDPSEVRANAFASTLLMPEEMLREAVGTTGLTEETFAKLACELMVSPSTLAYRLLKLRLVDAGTCDRYKAITGMQAAKLAGRGEQLAQRTAKAATTRAPGILLRDSYAAYESGQATLRPYANLLGADVDDLRRTLESEHGTHDAL
ncbi:XRE family transcriptional regulator [Streptomyces wuyuanensis]|uniref:XRE family transcriptional regulator n=1 Tax=Streptomyces wuyuanensis TaxID=1196353 RepID=UPI0038150B3C